MQPSLVLISCWKTFLLTDSNEKLGQQIEGVTAVALIGNVPGSYISIRSQQQCEEDGVGIWISEIEYNLGASWVFGFRFNGNGNMTSGWQHLAPVKSLLTIPVWLLLFAIPRCKTCQHRPCMWCIISFPKNESEDGNLGIKYKWAEEWHFWRKSEGIILKNGINNSWRESKWKAKMQDLIVPTNAAKFSIM